MEALVGKDQPPSIEAISLRSIASSGSKVAGDRVSEMLEQPETASLSVPEMLTLLRFFPEHHGSIRKRLESNKVEIVIAAVESLYRDAESFETRMKLATDVSKSTDVRRVAIQSLMHEDAVTAGEGLVKVFADTNQPVELRSEAAAAMRVFVQRRRRSLDSNTVLHFADVASSVAVDPTGQSELGQLKEMLLSELRN